MNDRMTDVRDHLLAATELLREEIAHAPDTTTAARRAGYLGDIHFTLQQIAEDE